MIVQTLERRYAVLQVLRSTADEEVSVCRDLQEEQNRLYTLVRFKDPSINRYILPMLLSQQSNPDFEDFLGLFSQDGDLYARFTRSGAPTLTQRLEDGLRLVERLEIGRSLTERMTLLNMPAPLQFEALREGNVTVDESMSVRFNYVLESMNGCFNVDIGFVCLRIQEIMQRLFAPELAAQAAPELVVYLRKLEQTVYKSYLEIYAGYDAVLQALLGREQAGAVTPRTWLFRLWERIKGLKRYVIPILGGLVLVVSLCYLVYTLICPPMPVGTPVIYDRIGTVDIADPADPQATPTPEGDPLPAASEIPQ